MFIVPVIFGQWWKPILRMLPVLASSSFPNTRIQVRTARAIGGPVYCITAAWWLGLFWREIGWWGFASPFASL